MLAGRCSGRCSSCKRLKGMLQWRGSVFPQSFAIALPCALSTAAIRVAMDEGYVVTDTWITNSAIWNGFTFLVGFLIFFRTSQAYCRFWDGCTAVHTMRLEWFEACSSLISYTRHSTSSEAQMESFHHLLVRLISILHASALAEIEDSSTDIDKVEAFKYPLLDVRAIDRCSLQTLMDTEDKVGLCMQWIQQLIVDHMSTGVLSIPPPLLTHAFQQLFNGVLAFHSAIKIASIPFPYSQMCDILLVMQSMGTPIITAQWVESPTWGGIFGFLLVFIYWCLNKIATDIENPFGHDSNDIDGEAMQTEMNRSLLLLLEPSTMRTPSLRTGRESVQDDSLIEAWKIDSAGDTDVLHKPRANVRTREVVFRDPNSKFKTRYRLKKCPSFATLKRSATLERMPDPEPGSEEPPESGSGSFAAERQQSEGGEPPTPPSVVKVEFVEEQGHTTTAPGVAKVHFGEERPLPSPIMDSALLEGGPLLVVPTEPHKGGGGDDLPREATADADIEDAFDREPSWAGSGESQEEQEGGGLGPWYAAEQPPQSVRSMAMTEVPVGPTVPSLPAPQLLSPGARAGRAARRSS